MKRTNNISILILLMLTSFGFAACSNNDDEDMSASLVGTWKLQRTYGWEIDPDTGEKSDYDETIYKNSADYQIYTFMEDNTYNCDYNPGSKWATRENGSYNVKGNKLYLNDREIGTITVSTNNFSIHLKDSSGESMWEFVRIK